MIMNTHIIELPITSSKLEELKHGDKILLSGVIYTARDKAHKRIVESLNRGLELGIPWKDTAIFYCGPSPVRPGKICGAIGPTTSTRMDSYTPILLEAGLKIIIGKGEIGDDVSRALKQHGAIYLTCPGGVSAVLARCIVSCETFLWGDLGAEAVYRMTVKDLPCFVSSLPSE